MNKICKVCFFIVLFSATSFAQPKKYYLNKDGSIFSQEKYDERKAKISTNLKNKFKSKYLVEELNELFNRNDSIVYNYTFHITDSPTKTQKEIQNKKEIIGKEFPIFNDMTLSGVVINLDDLKGKPTLINLWFTSCAPCIEEMPVLNKLQAENSDKFNFLSITYDSEKKVKKFLEKYKYDFEHIINSRKHTTNLGLNSFPVNLFLDKNGIVRVIEGNISYIFKDGKYVISDGAEFLMILEKLR